MNTGIAALPGFRRSVALLVKSERYSLTDVALMFGVTLERMRQLCKKLGIEQPGGSVGLLAVRIWDDEANRFRAVGRGELSARPIRARVEARRVSRRQHRQAVRMNVTATIHDLHTELGRVPTIGEVGAKLWPGVPSGQAGARLAARWYPSAARPAYKAIFREIYASAGLVPRPTGSPGHIAESKDRA